LKGDEEMTEAGILLPASYSIYIPALCLGRIPHQGLLRREYTDQHVWLVRLPGSLLSTCLLVDQGPVDDGEIETVVFNLSNKGFRLKKGEAVSKLILIR
jgi:hypothetical protein